MKISRLEIKDFRQFKDFSLDLTYPEGHPKAGEPLDKVCLIGQSGTGKTTLLEVVRKMQYHSSWPPFSHLDEGIELGVKLLDTNFTTRKNLHDDHRTALYTLEEQTQITQLGDKLSIDPWGIIFFPDSSVGLGDNRVSGDVGMVVGFRKFFIPQARGKQFWKLIMDDITQYQDELAKKRFAISRAVEAGKMEESQVLVKELRDWEEQNPGSLAILAEKFLDPILKRFQLKVKRELESISEAKFINILTLQGEPISEGVWSTGIKNIIFKTVPLFALNPKDFVILVDEPENSLYPDIQAHIVDLYTQVAPQAQFFFATHSPIIASSFEPWEIVDLEFDPKTGKVVRNLYYDPAKGNHVDHYEINPRLLSYQGIYEKVFDFPQDGSEARDEKLAEAASLKGQAEYLREQNQPQAARDKYQEYRSLAKKLGITPDEKD